MLSNITDSSLKAMAGLKREDESMEDLFKRIGKRAQGNHARAVLHRRCAADRGHCSVRCLSCCGCSGQ